nr:LamG domain-containing protein [Paenibacillus sp. 1-18]
MANPSSTIPISTALLDELIIYNRALTAQEIRGLASPSSTANARPMGADSYAEGAD